MGDPYNPCPTIIGITHPFKGGDFGWAALSQSVATLDGPALSQSVASKDVSSTPREKEIKNTKRNMHCILCSRDETKRKLDKNILNLNLAWAKSFAKLSTNPKNFIPLFLGLFSALRKLRL
ncbi:hypothetical protein CsSME_00030894 [Camellia sinensis var. sinensis]